MMCCVMAQTVTSNLAMLSHLFLTANYARPNERQCIA